MDHGLLARFSVRIAISVPTNDYRNPPDTLKGDHHFFGNGVMHHDLISIPFFGRMYDTAVVRHPLSVTDCYDERRPSSTHIFYLLDILRDLRWHSRTDDTASKTELRARQDSIDVLRGIQKRLYANIVGPVPSSPSDSSESTCESSESSGDSLTSEASYVSSRSFDDQAAASPPASDMLEEGREEAIDDRSPLSDQLGMENHVNCGLVLCGSDDHCPCQ